MSQYVFYHGKCPDGELSAAIFKYSKLDNNSIYIPWYHHDKENIYNVFNKLKSTDILYFLDVAPTPEDINNYLKNNKVIIIDHHKNQVEKALSIVNTNIYVFHDPEYKKSGCQLTWEYIYNNTIYPKPLKYIGDMDVWNFSDVNTEPFNVAYKEYFKFSDKLNYLERIELMNTILNINKNMINIIVNRGNEMLQEYKEIAKSYFTSISDTILQDEKGENYITLDIECDYVKYFKYIIDYAKENYTNYDIIRIKRDYDNKICYSLRVIKDGIFVDSIARNYGGNGHPLAAGYNI